MNTVSNSREIIVDIPKVDMVMQKPIEVPRLEQINKPEGRGVVIKVPKTETIEQKNSENGSDGDIIDLTKPENLRSKRDTKESQLTKLDVLRKLSSGTGLREGLDNIVSGGMGGLIVISNPYTDSIFQGGFKINCKFTSKKIFELAKMDGAIILSEDFKKVLYANTLLTPNKNFVTSETGTRHQAAERTAKQIGTMVIAVSQRIGKITIYYGNSKYVLQDTDELLRRATETMQILEKQREVFDELIVNLNLLEINNMVSVAEVCSVLERLEMIRKMSAIINEYLIELGKEGIILRMRMREITKGIEKTQDLIMKDYFAKPIKARLFFNNLSFDGLLDLENIASVIFGKSLETSIVPKGYRILSKTHLSKDEIECLVRHFKNLDGIFAASKESIRKVLKDNPDRLQKELNNLREHIVVGKNV